MLVKDNDAASFSQLGLPPFREIFIRKPAPNQDIPVALCTQ